MRYVKTKTVVTRIIDETINDPETVKSILKILHEKSLSCSIRLSEGPTLNNVRIVEYNDNEIVIQIHQPHHSLRKKAKNSEIEFLSVDALDTVLAAKENVSRWMLLDPSE